MRLDVVTLQQQLHETGKQLISSHFKEVTAQIEQEKVQNIVQPRPQIFDTFFDKNVKQWMQFYSRIVNKTFLEVVNLPFAILPTWLHWLSGRKIVIGPLVQHFDSYTMTEFQKPLYDPTIEKIAVPLDTFVPELEGKIDGCILFDGGTDYIADPLKAIENITKYAENGCMLLFMGAENVTELGSEFRKLMGSYGWMIVRYVDNKETANISERRSYGCVAIKTDEKWTNDISDYPTEKELIDNGQQKEVVSENISHKQPYETEPGMPTIDLYKQKVFDTTDKIFGSEQQSKPESEKTSNILSKKTLVVEVVRTEGNDQESITIANDGFSNLELFGLLAVIKQECELHIKEVKVNQ